MDAADPRQVEPCTKFWLDDIRDPALHGHIGWVWVATADAAIELLASGCVSKASLDHDLTISQTLGYPDQEKTGYDVVLWMEKNKVWPPDGVVVHSENPAGRFKMEQAIKNYYGA